MSTAPNPAPAFLGTALGGFLCLGLVILFIVALIKTFTTKKTGWVVAMVVTAIAGVGAAVVLAVVATRSLARVGAELREKSLKTKVVTASDGSCTLEVVNAWATIPNLNEDAVVQVGNLVREEYCIVIREPKTDFSTNFKGFAELAVGMTAKNAGLTGTAPLQRIEVGPHSAYQTKFSGTVEKIKVVYLMTAVETDDSFCQIICWTLPSSEERGMPLFEAATASFRAKPVATAGRRIEKQQATTDKNLPVSTRVKQHVVELLGVEPEKVTPTATFTSLGADDVDHVELIMAIEEDFEVEVPDEAAETFKTPADVTAWLEKATSEK